MFLKCISRFLVLTAALSLSATFASTNSNTQIEDLLNDFQYQMDGWDGVNSAVKEDAQARLSDGLKSLVDSGVKAEEIQSVMEKKILAKNKKAEYKALVESLKAQNLSEVEVAKAAMSFMSATNATGSAFAGGGATSGGHWKKGALLAGFLVVAIVTVVVVVKCHKGKKHHPKKPTDDCPPKNEDCPPQKEDCPPVDYNKAA